MRSEGQLSRQGTIGRPRTDDRQTLNAILHVLVTGCWWNDLPADYGHYSRAWRRLRQGARDGTLPHLWRHLLREPTGEESLKAHVLNLDGHVRATGHV